MEYYDDLRRAVTLATPPLRVVSLVPSITETLFAIGAGERVVGVTRYCTHPPAEVARVTTIGGTKNPELEQILDLAPDLVIANDEENRAEDFAWLVAHHVPVYVTAPRTVPDGIRLIEQLGAVLDCQRLSAPLVQQLSEHHDWLTAQLKNKLPVRVFCPIWRKPWMSFNRDTYIDDMIRTCGGLNILCEKTERYCTISLEEVAAYDPQVILLPSEPYPFSTKHFVHLKPLAETMAGQGGHIYCIDGMALCWYGPRIAAGLTEISRLLTYVRETLDT